MLINPGIVERAHREIELEDAIDFLVDLFIFTQKAFLKLLLRFLIKTLVEVIERHNIALALIKGLLVLYAFEHVFTDLKKLFRCARLSDTLLE